MGRAVELFADFVRAGEKEVDSQVVEHAQENYSDMELFV